LSSSGGLEGSDAQSVKGAADQHVGGLPLGVNTELPANDLENDKSKDGTCAMSYLGGVGRLGICGYVLGFEVEQVKFCSSLRSFRPRKSARRIRTGLLLRAECTIE